MSTARRLELWVLYESGWRLLHVWTENEPGSDAEARRHARQLGRGGYSVEIVWPGESRQFHSMPGVRS